MSGIRSAHYQIRVEGVLCGRWSDWFEGLRVTSDAPGESSICGAIADQAALHGVLAKVRDLGLVLVEVRRIDTGSVMTGGRE